MVKYLIDKGPDKYARFFATIKKGTRWDQALQQTYGFDYTTFENEFRDANGLPAQQQASPTSPPQQASPTTRATATATARATTAAPASGGSDSASGNDSKPVMIIVAIAVAFISGWASIWFLLRYLRTHSTYVFIWYRYALGAVMIVLLVTGMVKA